jgi:metallo-beta-lactamase family protein
MPVPAHGIDYLFITHAHHDNIGRIPDLIDAGFCGEIICTHGTKSVLLLMLHDAMAFSDRSQSRVRELEKQIDELSWGFEYDQPFKLKRGITFKLSQAGHILGSCFIRFEIPEGTGKGSPKKRSMLFSIIFSGVLGCENTPILPDPDLP